MTRSILLTVLFAALISPGLLADDEPPAIAVTIGSLRVPRVGTSAEFDRLIREYEKVEGRVHATLKPASWVSVVVRFRPGGEERAAGDVWASEPELHRVHQARLIPATDTFITPGEMRRFREAAEQTARSSTFELSGPFGEPDDLARASMTIYWRFGARGTVDLYGISRVFRRDGAVLSDDANGKPVVVLLHGPTREYEAELSRESAGENAPAHRGIPADRIVDPGSGHCGIVRELPEGIVRGETAEIQPLLVESSRLRPVYPEQGRIYRTGGTVILDVILDQEGKVVAVVVKRAVPGFPSFARSVVDAVCGMRYLPAMHSGAPAQSVIEFSSTFELR